MREIENKEEVLKRLDALRRPKMFREACPFCWASSDEFRVSRYLVEVDNKSFIQFFCRKCGYTMLLDYNVLMGKTKCE